MFGQLIARHEVINNRRFCACNRCSAWKSKSEVYFGNELRNIWFRSNWYHTLRFVDPCFLKISKLQTNTKHSKNNTNNNKIQHFCDLREIVNIKPVLKTFTFMTQWVMKLGFFKWQLKSNWQLALTIQLTIKKTKWHWQLECHWNVRYLIGILRIFVKLWTYGCFFVILIKFLSYLKYSWISNKNVQICIFSNEFLFIKTSNTIEKRLSLLI